LRRPIVPPAFIRQLMRLRAGRSPGFSVRSVNRSANRGYSGGMQPIAANAMHFHSLKHSIATILASRVDNISRVKTHLGHAAISSTIAILPSEPESNSGQGQGDLEPGIRELVRALPMRLRNGLDSAVARFAGPRVAKVAACTPVWLISRFRRISSTVTVVGPVGPIESIDTGGEGET
jgi:hypothetical protein